MSLPVDPMRLTRLAFFTLLIGAAASALRALPSAPSERAAVVCKPVLFLANVAAEISSSMNDSGRIGPARQPWHQETHRACLRIAERVFRAAAES
jgi:hypothetical protein